MIRRAVSLTYICQSGSITSWSMLNGYLKWNKITWGKIPYWLLTSTDTFYHQGCHEISQNKIPWPFHDQRTKFHDRGNPVCTKFFSLKNIHRCWGLLHLTRSLLVTKARVMYIMWLLDLTKLTTDLGLAVLRYTTMTIHCCYSLLNFTRLSHKPSSSHVSVARLSDSLRQF